jgi:hypothetical protein
MGEMIDGVWDPFMQDRSPAISGAFACPGECVP